MIKRYDYRTEIVAPQELQKYFAGLEETERVMSVHQELVSVGGIVANPGQPNVMMCYRVFIETDLQPWPPSSTDREE